MDPAVRLFIMAAMFIGFGLWCWAERAKYPPPRQWDAKHINEAAGYLLNNVGPFILVPAGMAPLVWGIVFLRRKIVADETGIGYAGGKKIAWNEITSLDASQLRSKSIIRLHAGNNRLLVLDAWKLKNFRDLVAFVETRVQADVKKL